MPIPNIIFDNAVTGFIGYGVGVHGWRRGWRFSRTLALGLGIVWALFGITELIQVLP